MLLSAKALRRVLGALWLIDGFLKLQPYMFTNRMIPFVLLPRIPGQPGPVAVSLQEIAMLVNQHLTAADLLFAIIEIEIGLFLLVNLWVRETIIVSVVWSLLVWYAGEGMGLLLTGQASAMIDAPGAVLFYALLGLLVYPRATSPQEARDGKERIGLLSRTQARWVLGGFWIFAALLQLQPHWWQPGSFADAVSDGLLTGGLDGTLIDPLIRPLASFANATAALEVPENALLILAFLGLGIALIVARPALLRRWLGISMVFSFLMWWGMQGFAALFSGLATDFESGPLLIILALACWPKAAPRPAEAQADQTVKQPEAALPLTVQLEETTPLAQPTVS
jgi:hypothetical protein